MFTTCNNRNIIANRILGRTLCIRKHKKVTQLRRKTNSGDSADPHKGEQTNCLKQKIQKPTIPFRKPEEGNKVCGYKNVGGGDAKCHKLVQTQGDRYDGNRGRERSPKVDGAQGEREGRQTP